MPSPEIKFSVTLFDTSPRAKLWRFAFGRLNDIPVISPMPHWGVLPGHVEPTAVYMLDAELITPDERGRLIAAIAETFNLPISDVARSFAEDGCPIIATDTLLTVHPSGMGVMLADDGQHDGPASAADDGLSDANHEEPHCPDCGRPLAHCHCDDL